MNPSSKITLAEVILVSEENLEIILGLIHSVNSENASLYPLASLMVKLYELPPCSKMNFSSPPFNNAW